MTALIGRPPTPPIVRFTRRVDKVDDGCWLWTGCLVTGGYGAFNDGKRQVNAHIWAYRHFIGEVPAGLTLDHTCHSNDLTCVGGPCRHRRCVNPNHLEPVTQRENTLRGRGLSAANAAKTHCKRGHAFTPTNTGRYIDRFGRSHRVCRACHAALARRLRAVAA